jgi:uncharacterized membrane protein
MVKLKYEHDSVILTLQPNRSANWRQNKIIIMVMTFFVMIIAIAWSVVGVWIILPFAGFEVGLLAFLMYRTSYSTYQKQIITIHPNEVIFQAGVYYQKQYLQFVRDHLTIKTIEPNTAYEHTMITLEDQQNKVEIGAFLNQQDRKITLKHLKDAQLYVHSDKWWQKK